MYKNLHLKLFINSFSLKINSTFLLYSELYWVFLLLLEINTLIPLKWQMCFWWSDVNLFTILHTHIHTHIRLLIFVLFSLLSLSHSVVASLPGGFHVQLVLLEWSAAAAAPKAATASARRLRWKRPAFITVCAFWVFCLFFFLVFSFFFVHSSTFVCVQLLWQFIHQAAKRANNNNDSEAHTTREADQLRRAAAAPAPLLLLLLFPLFFILFTSRYWVSAYKRITCIAISAASVVVVECFTVTMQTFCHTHDKSLFFVPLSEPLSPSHSSAASSHPHTSFSLSSAALLAPLTHAWSS